MGGLCEKLGKGGLEMPPAARIALLIQVQKLLLKVGVISRVLCGHVSSQEACGNDSHLAPIWA